MDSLVKVAIDELAGEKCACGKKKNKNQSFCRECYFALPQKLRSDLYKGIRDGYAEVYAEAKTYLRAETNRLQQGGLF